MSDTNRILSVLSICSLAFAVIFLVTSVMSGFGTRMGWWDFRRGLLLLKWAAYGEGSVAAIALIGSILVFSRGQGNGLPLFVIACVLSIAAFIVPFRMYLIARTVPAIHDITTDTENPPRFEVVLSMRTGALNPTEYGGPEIAGQQKKAYPDIAPLIIDALPAQTFDRARSAAETMGWEIVSADSAAGRIEATDTTFWFGFKDDIVIRITPYKGGSRIDIRSLSRVGRSDVGANALRIRKFLNLLTSPIL